jgi:Protein of unknown function (DUF4058)
MPSPFPGMDPYLERHWGDVHARLIIYASDSLNKSLPRDLRARVEERVSVETPAGERPIVPDVRILKRAIPGKKSARGATSVATAEPLIVPLGEPITESYIEIRDISTGHRVITVIEILSPSNKTPGDARNEYLRQQQELFAGQVSLVAGDLLRSGRRLLPFPLECLPVQHQTPYGVCITRGWQLKQVEFYPISLCEPLPTIRVPLRQSDADASLNLQQLIEQCYENGSYTDDIDYRDEADPPLQTADDRWADALLRKQGKRSRNGATSRRRRRNGER